MTNQTITMRSTKYCKKIQDVLCTLGHATNTELLEHLRFTYPDVSATTLHRATARLASRGIIATAPPAQDGSMRYDANTLPHDHFHCSHCDMLRDTDIKDEIAPLLEQKIGGCTISGRITISGLCNTCKE